MASAPALEPFSLKAPLPEMKTMYEELNRREEEYIGPDNHGFDQHDSEWYQRNELGFLTNAMLVEQMRVGTALHGVISGRVRDLIDVILDFSEDVTRWQYGTMNEALTGLRYWEVNSDGSRTLFREWVELFTKTDYLEWTPPEVQGFFYALTEDQKREAAGPPNLKTLKPYGRPAVPHQHNPPLPANVQTPVQSLGKRKIINNDGESHNLFDRDHIKRKAISVSETQSFSTRRNTMKTPLINPGVVTTSHARPLLNGQSHLTPVSVPSQSPVSTSPASSTNDAVVSNQPILPAPSAMPVYGQTLTLKAAGIERYPWTQVRQRMWMLKHNKLPADLPAEALRVTYNPAHTGTPENGDLRLLGHMHVTICEVLTYFPLSPSIREIAYRLVNAQWEASDIVKYILWTRSIADVNAVKRSTVHRMLDSGKKWATGKVVLATAELGSLDFASGLTGYGADLIDVPLFHLGDNVLNHPSGQDAGILTQCIARCRATGDQNTAMAGAEVYATRHGIRDHYSNIRNTDVKMEAKDALDRVSRTAATWFRTVGLKLK